MVSHVATIALQFLIVASVLALFAYMVREQFDRDRFDRKDDETDE